MKKIIALLMAIVMMMAIAVPAFAAATETQINQAEPTPDASTGAQTGTADVYTTFDENTDWSYTVTIPADTSIPWNNKDEHDMTYKVESQLLIGASLTISVSGSGKMKADGTAEELDYTITGGGAVTFDAVNPANTTAPNVIDGKNVKVAITSFEGKPVGEYRDTLTFTVVYDSGKTTP